MNATNFANSTRSPIAVLDNGSRWEYRRLTRGGMANLWAIGGGASLSLPLDRIDHYEGDYVRIDLVPFGGPDGETHGLQAEGVGFIATGDLAWCREERKRVLTGETTFYELDAVAIMGGTEE